MRKIILIVVMLFTAFAVFFMEGSAPNQFEFSDNSNQRSHLVKNFNVSDTLSVMTYNIGYLSGMTNNVPLERTYDFVRKNREQLIKVINDVSPDLVAVQEIDFSSDRSFLENQADIFQEDCGYSNSFLSVNWNKRYVPFPYWPISAHFGKIVSGQAVFSKFPMGDSKGIPIENNTDKSFLYKAFYLDKLVQETDVKVGEKTIKLLHVHLEAFNKKARVISAFHIRGLFEKYSSSMPVLLIGDFNSRPEYVVEDAMSEIMKAEYATSAISQSVYQKDSLSCFTFNSKDPFQMIDYIIYNNNLIASIDAKVIHEAGEVSDHLPVYMEFVLKGENDED